MRQCAIFLAVLLLAQAAVAGQNPDLRVHLDFNPPHGADRIDPEPGTFFDVYIVLDRFSAEGGCRVLPLAFERTFGGYVAGQTMLLPGLCLGDVEDPHIGWVCGTFDCSYPDATGLVVFGYVTYCYTGPAGVIRIIRTEVDQGGAIDCDFNTDYYCIGGHAGVWMNAPDGEPECSFGSTSVEGSSWGLIKSLYR